MKNFVLNKKNDHGLLILIALVFLVITIIGSVLLYDAKIPGSVYNLIAFIIITLWMCIFTVYFVWALHFYNINFGLTQGEWEQIEQSKQQRRDGQTFNDNDLAGEPLENPYKTETFGLPNGTVRGMIAFTLLFGAIALLIASFSPQNQLNPNTLLVDQFDFFKTAFLMMIAFYFGSRSLEFLKGKPAPIPTPVKGKDPLTTDAAGVVQPAPTAENPEPIPNIQVSVAGNVSSVPMITQVKDPMAFNEF
ncbi:MAG: hypothetical protein WCX31_05745 [Salinivirgaceae bacterium]|jgi:hypothetical protein